MISVIGLRKKYGGKNALDGVTFSVRSFGTVGLLGINGAGKTTLMRILACCCLPSGGSAEVCGFSIFTDSLAVRRRLGYMSEYDALYDDMTPDEFLRFIAGARGASKNASSRLADDAMRKYALTDVRGVSISSLSHGYRRRVSFAQAVIHDPAVLLLDEPFNGLDPNQIADMRALVNDYALSHTVILSTHSMSEAENLCASILLLHNGRLAASGSADDVMRSAGAASLEGAFAYYTNANAENAERSERAKNRLRKKSR